MAHTPRAKWQQAAGIKYLVFSGGGARGLAYAGTMLALAEYSRIGVLPVSQIEGCAGSSIGSLIALAYVIGVQCDVIIHDLIEDHVLDIINPEMDLNRMYMQYGLDTGDCLKQVVLHVLRTRFTAPEDVTLRQVFTTTRKKLVCACADVASGELAYVSHETHPEMPAWKAVVASMSVPILFEPVKYKDHLFVDGCAFETVPIKPFGDATAVLTFRFRVDVPKELGEEVLRGGFPSYVRRLMECCAHFHEKTQLEGLMSQQHTQHRVIDVECGDIKALQFSITHKQKLDCVMRGMLSTLYGLWRFRLGELVRGL